jgi:hypothetical protein
MYTKLNVSLNYDGLLVGKHLSAFPIYVNYTFTRSHLR